MSLRSLAYRLRKRWPNLKVAVKTGSVGPNCFACTERDSDEDSYLIRIDAKIRHDFQAFILAHEWAHAVAWKDDPDNDHGPAFWKAYMECFDVYQDWCFNKD